MINSYLNIDPLSLVMLGVIWLIGLIVIVYSRSFMRLDRDYPRFMLQLFSLIAVTSVMVTSNHMVIFMASWAVANLLLVSLMAHNRRWKNAIASARLARNTLMTGSVALMLAALLLVCATGSLQISTIITTSSSIQPMILFAAVFCTFVTVMAQAGLWPFHRWLLSSLNAPTPVSAMMHAGLVNGSGYLLIRFAPLYFQHQLLMKIIFMIGAVSALLGTAYKLIQSDIKRMLACSTMGQMGFMTMLCGLGLYPFALAHLLWHALFKANLFLSANEILVEARRSARELDIVSSFVCIAASLTGLGIFMYLLNMNLFILDGRIFIAAIMLFVFYQLSVIYIQSNVFSRFMVIGVVTSFAVFYANYLAFIDGLLQASLPSMSESVSILHVLTLVIFVLTSLLFLQRRQLSEYPLFRELSDYMYVKCLNGSQPDPDTVTTTRSSYQF